MPSSVCSHSPSLHPDTHCNILLPTTFVPSGLNDAGAHAPDECLWARFAHTRPSCIRIRNVYHLPETTFVPSGLNDEFTRLNAPPVFARTRPSLHPDTHRLIKAPETTCAIWLNDAEVTADECPISW